MTERRSHPPDTAATDQPRAPQQVVPDVIGLSLEEACEAAAWAGTRINATSTERALGPRGVVVAQSPAPGTRVKPRWQIHVLVSASGSPKAPVDA